MTLNLNGEIIDEIREIAIRDSVNKIVLFGSRARGDNRQTSDIDLAIFCDKESQYESKIYFDLDDIETLIKLDIVFIKENTNKKLLENIQKDGVTLYEKK